jgi:sugar/nucleoside kinase (ribokinase family)
MGAGGLFTRRIVNGVCSFLKEKDHIHMPAIPLNSRKNAGAGDAFWAGFLCAS